MRQAAWQTPAGRGDELTMPIAAGDLVRTGENFHPHYQVVALSDGRAWIRDVQHGTDHVMPIDRCRRIDDGRG